MKRIRPRRNPKVRTVRYSFWCNQRRGGSKRPHCLPWGVRMRFLVKVKEAKLYLLAFIADMLRSKIDMLKIMYPRPPPCSCAVVRCFSAAGGGRPNENRVREEDRQAQNGTKSPKGKNIHVFSTTPLNIMNDHLRFSSSAPLCLIAPPNKSSRRSRRIFVDRRPTVVVVPDEEMQTSSV